MPNTSTTPSPAPLRAKKTSAAAGIVHTPTSAGPDSDGYGTSAGAAGVESSPDDNPEVLVGAAFAGGLIAALILKRLGSHD